MHRSAQRPVGFGDKLPFQYALADADNRMSRIACVLGDRQHKLRRYRDLLDRLGCRHLLVCLQPQTTVQFTQVIGWRTHDRLCILMQSTGQGATQSSQPVHSALITVCII